MRLLTISVLAITLAACSSTPRGPYEPQADIQRDTARAQELTQRAVDLMLSDPEKAESLLRDALTADLYHGPAHNNLGVLLLERDDLYGAASEFQWARTLLPGLPDPRLNLGLVLEQAGRIDEAIDMYATALEVYPNHLPSTQALARAQLRYNRADATTRDHLDEIALRGDDRWRNWARLQLARLR